MAFMVDQINYKPGASLRGFKEFFPKGEIYGADFDKTILFQEDRIHTFYVDQTDPESIKNLWNEIDGEFDIMIDDALHIFEANKTFFLNSVHKLSKNGIYIIEDVTNEALLKWNAEAPIMQTYYPYLHFCIVHIPLESNTESNRLIIIQKTDKLMEQKKDNYIKTDIVWSNYQTELCGILNQYGTDKAVFSDHRYSRLYSRLFHELRYLPIRYFEVGIGTINPQIESNMAHMVNTFGYKPGASLRGFKEFFPKGEIYGADFDKTILFQEDRIHTFYVDQTDPESIKNLWNEIDGEFDIMIDDALHIFEANKTFFLNSVHKLSKNGIYIIEDITNEELPKWVEEVPQMRICYPDLNFFIEKFEITLDTIITLIIIQRRD